MNTTYLVVGAAALALSACGTSESETADIAAAPETETMTQPVDAGADPAMATGAQAFVDAAAASDMFEIEAGNLARDMGASQEVKDFGAMMVRDHTQSTTDLKAAAAQVEGVTVNPQLTAKQQSDLAALRAAGDGFDALYKRQQLAAHEQALALLRTQAERGEAAPLKAFAAKTAPVVEGHLEEARTLP